MRRLLNTFTPAGWGWLVLAGGLGLAAFVRWCP